MKNISASNIVDKKCLRKVQQWTLNKLAESVYNSAGPYGSTTQIIHDNQFNEYTKDGHTIIQAISFNGSIESAIQKEITELTRHIVKTVGDGSTSVVLLSNFIFTELCKYVEEHKNIPPYKIIESFKKVTEDISNKIYERSRELTLEDVYSIAKICSNNDEVLSQNITDIYRQFGNNVYIEVGTSFSEDSYINVYDGLTLQAGYASTAFVNKQSTDDKSKESGCCELHNISIYAFRDPVDTLEMVDIFNAIIRTNILQPLYDENLDAMVPTVIIVPRFSRDVGNTFEQIEEYMYKLSDNAKPPLLILKSTGPNPEIYDDIIRLCGCTPIMKYIDPILRERDIEAGVAITVDNVVEKAAGFAAKVRSTALKTSFINPKEMFEYDEDGKIKRDEKGEYILGTAYTTLLNFLEAELSKVREENGDFNEIGNIKKRINSLKSNSVDYLVGGITVTDRDSLKALADDSVKNIRSAANKGVGCGANFEGYIASLELIDKYDDKLLRDICIIINDGYISIQELLYSSAGLEFNDYREESLKLGMPINLVTKQFDNSVLSTIDSDPVILEAISKIITIMFTTNQTLVQDPLSNVYMPFGKDMTEE